MIIVNEYAELQSYDQTATHGFKKRYVSQETLDWLFDNYSSWSVETSESNPICIEFKKNSFKLGAYVGYIESPYHNERIQINPKIELGDGDTYKSQDVLKKMLSEIYDLNAKELSHANLDHQDAPLHEWIITKFLYELEQLLHIGLKKDYERIEASQPFIKGRFLVEKQMRKAPGNDAIFDLEYDDFLFNGIENRLIHTALQYVLALTKNNDSLLQAYEFSEKLKNIPTIENAQDQFINWRNIPLLDYYSKIKLWCEIILTHIRPSFQQGMYQGISLLFSMPHLFEKYVAQLLKVKEGLRLHVQPRLKTLVAHQPKALKQQNWFVLEPDLAVQDKTGFQVILDTKWKLINQDLSHKKYDISQADLYQMFAYGHKYLDAVGSIILIYPKHEKFDSPLLFNFSDQLCLYVMPFDLLNGCLIHHHLIEHIL